MDNDKLNNNTASSLTDDGSDTAAANNIALTEKEIRKREKRAANQIVYSKSEE